MYGAEAWNLRKAVKEWTESSRHVVLYTYAEN